MKKSNLETCKKSLVRRKDMPLNKETVLVKKKPAIN
jgi:hypothetical protein